jgi:hypothetical protein
MHVSFLHSSLETQIPTISDLSPWHAMALACQPPVVPPCPKHGEHQPVNIFTNAEHLQEKVFFLKVKCCFFPNA